MTPVLQTLVAMGLPILALLTLIKRVPWIARWPGHVPAKRVDEKSVINGADYLPTLCALTGVTIDFTKFEGEDTSAAWLGKKEHVRAKPLLWKTGLAIERLTVKDAVFVSLTEWDQHIADTVTPSFA